MVFLASGLPPGSSLNAATGVFTWNGAGPIGNYSVTITPNDGTFNGAPQTVSIMVLAPKPASSGGGGGGGGSMGWLDAFVLLSLAGLSLYFGRRTGTRGKKQ